MGGVDVLTVHFLISAVLISAYTQHNIEETGYKSSIPFCCY